MKIYLVSIALIMLIPYCSVNSYKYEELKQMNELSEDTIVLLIEKQPGTDYIECKLVTSENAADSLMSSASKNFNFLDSQSKKLNHKLNELEYKQTHGYYKYISKYFRKDSKMDTVGASGQTNTCINPENDYLDVKDTVLSIYYNF